MSLITIDQLLESVDLDFEPRFVTKNKNGYIYIWGDKPHRSDDCWTCDGQTLEYVSYNHLKLSEFDGKDWTECIYEVPRKTTGKIEKIAVEPQERFEPVLKRVIETLNAVVDAVNELKGANQ